MNKSERQRKRREYNRRYNEKHKARLITLKREWGKRQYRKNPALSWEKQIKRSFNITAAQYNEILKKQNGVCAICKKKNKDERRLAVDHDHSSNQIRGLLCHHCNIVVGHLFDSKEMAFKTFEYLKKHAQLMLPYSHSKKELEAETLHFPFQQKLPVL